MNLYNITVQDNLRKVVVYDINMEVRSLMLSAW